MHKQRWPVLFCGVLFVLLLIVFSPAAVAAPGLSWHTDNVYYDSQDSLVIQGYFYNTGISTVVWVDRFDVQVNFRQNDTDWWCQAAGNYYALNIYLEPGDTRPWTFRITDVRQVLFDHWNVKWNVNYRYK